MFVVATNMTPPAIRLIEMKIRTGFRPSLSAMTPSTRLRIAENRLMPMKVNPIRTEETPNLLR